MKENDIFELLRDICKSIKFYLSSFRYKPVSESITVPASIEEIVGDFENFDCEDCDEHCEHCDEDFDDETEQMEFDLLTVKEFLDEYIGVCITGFETYEDYIPDLEKKITSKMVTAVEIIGESIWMELSKINGAPGGYLRINPSFDGEFIEKDVEADPYEDSKFKIIFIDGDAIEYIDPADDSIFISFKYKKK